MRFPALEHFEQDRRIGPALMRAYRACRYSLDVHEVRTIKRWTMNDLNTKRTLDTLVEWGYLIEHERGPRNERRFTLAYSVALPTVVTPTRSA